MSQFIDRRPNSRHKSAVNRRRFINRFKKQIKQAVSDAIANRSITDIEQGENINIPRKDIDEPNFHYKQGGVRNIVLPGNKEFIKGDKIRRPEQSGQGQGSSASPDGEGIDDFAFELSKEEFLEIFFEDLELPNLVRKQIAKKQTLKPIRAGFTSVGVPTNINITRSLRGALGRRIAIRASINKKLKALEEELLAANNKAPKDLELIENLKTQISKLKSRRENIPFIDSFDLRYNNKVLQPKPSTQAVMFCLMDVSGSMDEAKKDIAKRFFILLYLFLTKSYETIELVFIRHHTSAKEVNEKDFFYSRETGGTVVSSALELMYEIIDSRYPDSDWNIYGAQASDGDNWNNDSPKCRTLLQHNIMPYVRYFAYIEIMPRQHQSLWQAYLDIKQQFPNFSMQSIESATEIYPVFRDLFQKRAKGHAE